jgi:hypothetical protein
MTCESAWNKDPVFGVIGTRPVNQFQVWLSGATLHLS